MESWCLSRICPGVQFQQELLSNSNSWTSFLFFALPNIVLGEGPSETNVPSWVGSW